MTSPITIYTLKNAHGTQAKSLAEDCRLRCCSQLPVGLYPRARYNTYFTPNKNVTKTFGVSRKMLGNQYSLFNCGRYAVALTSETQINNDTKCINAVFVVQESLLSFAALMDLVSWFVCVSDFSATADLPQLNKLYF